MQTNRETTALAAARAHIEAWSHHDYAKAREGLAPGVRVRAMTTQPIMKEETDLTGADAYMEGLKLFAGAVEPGSATIVSAIGDAHNALVTLTVKAAFAPGAPTVTMPMARLYRVGDDAKIVSEQVIFYAAEG
jgi:hypothetical protein